MSRHLFFRASWYLFPVSETLFRSLIVTPVSVFPVKVSPLKSFRNFLLILNLSILRTKRVSTDISLKFVICSKKIFLPRPQIHSLLSEPWKRESNTTFITTGPPKTTPSPLPYYRVKKQDFLNLK